jgi:adenine-specific DNA-methyltransferase
MTTTDKNTLEPATSNSKQLALLKKHFANCFDKNGSFIPAKLQEIVQDSAIEVSKEGYSMNWLGKSYARLLANEHIRTLLQADAAHNAKPANVNSQNLLIRGDNLEVLKHLMGAYSEQVKMIYIDPPYNTGSDGFVYQDDRKFTVDELSSLAGISDTEAKRILDFTTSKSNSHSAWLTFMYPRLYLAKELLRDDGVIFISIDDNEQAQLKILCDEVFSEENFVADFIWHHRKSGQNDTDVSMSHNYTLCFAKNRSQFSLNALGVQSEKFSNLDNDERGAWVADPMDAPGIRENLSYSIVNPTTKKTFQPPQGRHWRFTEAKYIEALEKNRIVFGKTGKSKPQFKRFLSEAENKGTNPFTIWGDIDTATDGTKQLMDIFDGKKVFETPKPLGLIKRILMLGTTTENVVLDFFAGSGTTAHAVMQLNAEDGGNRRFVCVQIDEKTDAKSEAFKAGYASIFDITKARIEKAASKIIADNPINTAASGDYGFKIFETLPMFDKYLDEPDELTENLKLFDATQLTQADRHNLMLTWALRDRIELTETLKPIDLSGYTAYTAKNILYFIEPNITLNAVIKLLEQLDDLENMKDFKPNKLVVCGWLIESKIQREMSEALKHYNNRKGIELTLDIRYN